MIAESSTKSPPTLVLNPWGVPHRVVNWEEAVILVYTEKVDVLEEYEETVSSPSITMNIPAVIRLRKAIKPFKTVVKFSRINVFQRDDFKCQYCGKKKQMHDLNYDHVIPRKQGGKTTWDNIVAACAGSHGCNSKKGAKTPAQAGMRLLNKPFKPKTLPTSPPLIGLKTVPKEWAPYLSADQMHHVG